MIPGARLLADAVGAIGQGDAVDAQPLYGPGLPKVFAGEQEAFFLQRHLVDNSFVFHYNLLLLGGEGPPKGGPSRLIILLGRFTALAEILEQQVLGDHRDYVDVD